MHFMCCACVRQEKVEDNMPTSKRKELMQLRIHKWEVYFCDILCPFLLRRVLKRRRGEEIVMPVSEEVSVFLKNISFNVSFIFQALPFNACGHSDDYNFQVLKPLKGKPRAEKFVFLYD